MGIGETGTSGSPRYTGQPGLLKLNIPIRGTGQITQAGGESHDRTHRDRPGGDTSDDSSRPGTVLLRRQDPAEQATDPIPVGDLLELRDASAGAWMADASRLRLRAQRAPGAGCPGSHRPRGHRPRKEVSSPACASSAPPAATATRPVCGRSQGPDSEAHPGRYGSEPPRPGALKGGRPSKPERGNGLVGG